MNDEFYLLCSNGQIYKIKGIEGKQLLEMSNLDNDATTCLNETLLRAINVERISNHPLANSILIEHKNQAIKINKIKYGWPVDYFDLQQDRIKLAQRILKVNNQDMIEDIRTLVKSSLDIAYDAYFYLMQRLVETGKLNEFVEFVESIQNEEKSNAMFQKTINIFINLVQDEDFMEGSDIMNYVEASQFLLEILKENMDEFNYNQQSSLINTLKYIYELNKEFNIRVSFGDMKKADKKFSSMKSCIVKIPLHYMMNKVIYSLKLKAVFIEVAKIFN